MKQNINTGDSRFSSYVVLQEGNIWAVQSVAAGAGSALRWLRILEKEEGDRVAHERASRAFDRLRDAAPRRYWREDGPG